MCITRENLQDASEQISQWLEEHSELNAAEDLEALGIAPTMMSAVGSAILMDLGLMPDQERVVNIARVLLDVIGATRQAEGIPVVPGTDMSDFEAIFDDESGGR